MDQELKQQLNRIEKFLFTNVATKEELGTLEGKVTNLGQAINSLTASVEKLAKLVNDMLQEHSVLKHQVLVMQEWIRKAAEKIGVEFKL